MCKAPTSVAAFTIDVATQHVFPLAELPDHVPRRRGGKKLHKATGFRWAKSDPPLPTIQIGGTKCTSLEALQWWCEQRTARGEGRPPAPLRTSLAHRRHLRRVDEALDHKRA